MNNKKKVISYMEKETNFNGSFSDIEHRINVRNIIIKEKERRIGSFNKLKIAFLCLTCSIFCFVGGYQISKMFETPYYIVNSYIEYDTYEEMEEAYYYYQELYNDEEKTLFNIELDGVIHYEYRLNACLQYKDDDEFDSMSNIKPEIKCFYDSNSILKIEYLNLYDNSNSFKWIKINSDSLLEETNILVDKNTKTKIISLFTNNNNIIDMLIIQSYISNKLSNL